MISARLFVIILTIGTAACVPNENASNVCHEIKIVKSFENVETPIQYPIKYKTMCGLIPCDKTRYETRIDRTIRTVAKEVEIAKCCPGYTETPDFQCAPICINSCGNGRCSEPNVCKCDPEPTISSPGFAGSSCNRFVCLQADRWGEKCDIKCDCPENSYCSASTGRCICRAGWQGTNCREECTPSMKCGGLELPPIIDTEANVIPDTFDSANMARLEDMRPRALQMNAEMDSEPVQAQAGLIATHMGINLALILISSILIFTVYVYNKRLNRERALRQELQYGPYSAGTGSGATYSSGGSSYDSSSNVSGRPPMPLPGDDFLSKNLSFAAATRSMLSPGVKGSYTRVQDKHREATLIDSKIEKHLIESQEAAKQNLYSDIDSSLSGRTYTIESCPNAGIQNIVNMNIRANSSENNDYQVPRSRVSSDNVDHSALASGPDQSDTSSNIYEELSPRNVSDKH